MSEMKVFTGKPELKNEKEMIIGAYWIPKPTDENYKTAKENGITHMMVNTMIAHEVYDEGYYKTPFELAEKYGLKIIMHAMGGGYRFIRKYAEYFRRSKTFDGVLAVDEPPCTGYPFFAQDYETFKTDFYDYPYYINLLPYYANGGQLGWVSYEQYVKENIEVNISKINPEVRALMCDCYPLKKENKILEKYLYNLEVLRENADEVDADLHLYLQDQGFWGNWRQPTTAREITFQAYVGMAYGARGLHHYPYLTPAGSLDDEKGIVDFDESKTFVYPLTKTANDEIKAIDGYILEFKNRAVIKSLSKINGKPNENFDNCKKLKDGYGLIEKVESDYDAIVGCFTRDDDLQGFMAVNFEEPLTGKDNDITLYISKANSAIVIENGKERTEKLKDGKLTLKVKVGGGVFVVPYNE